MATVTGNVRYLLKRIVLLLSQTVNLKAQGLLLFPPLPSDQQFPQRTSQVGLVFCVEITQSREKANLCQTGRQESNQLWHVK